MSTPFAEATIHAEAPDRERSPFKVTLSAPAENPDGAFVCEVSMPHKSAPFGIWGADSLQSVVLAIAYAHVQFELLVDRGWRFYRDGTDDAPFDPRTLYFPPGERPPAV